MPAEPTVAAGYADELLKFAVAHGADRLALLKAAGIASGELADPDERLPLAGFIALIHAAQGATGDPALALRFGCESDTAEASIAGLIGRSAGTVAEAIALLNRYGRLIVDIEHSGPERFQIVEGRTGHWVVDRRKRPGSLPELSECTFGRLVAVGRQFFPDADYVKAVQFAHEAPSYAPLYQEILGAPVAFDGDVDKVQFDPVALERPVAVKQPRYALSILAEHAEALLARLDRPSSVRRQVEEVLSRTLPEGRCNQDHVAQWLGLSRRTFHRRLKAEGTTFAKVLDELRSKLASDHLAAGHSVKRAAHLLGFSDAAAFSRAFKRWTGVSPAERRRSAADLQRRYEKAPVSQ